MRANSDDTCLDSALESYSAAADAACNSRSAGYRRWAIYAAATGSALAMATSADASIITGFSGASATAPRNSSTSNHVLTPVPIGSSLGLLVLGAHWYQYPASGAFPASTSASVVMFGSGARVLVNSFSSVKRFNSGVLFTGSTSSSARWAYFGGVAKKCACGVYGQFASGVPGYAALQLADGRLGWIQLQWESTGGDGYPNKLTALNWGVEVPEPGTMELSLLAAGAMGIAALRKRRREAREAEANQN